MLRRFTGWLLKALAMSEEGGVPSRKDRHGHDLGLRQPGLKTSFHGWTLGSHLYKRRSQNSHCGVVETNPTWNHEVVGMIPDPVQWVKDPELLQAVV